MAVGMVSRVVRESHELLFSALFSVLFFFGGAVGCTGVWIGMAVSPVRIAPYTHVHMKRVSSLFFPLQLLLARFVKEVT